jgi:hypothetical protein
MPQFAPKTNNHFMHRISLLAKTAFICNLAFLACLFLQRWAPEGRSVMVSLVAILGLVLGMWVVNPLSNLVNGILLWRRKPLFLSVPRWLVLSNLCFFLLQIIYIFRTWS